MGEGVQSRSESQTVRQYSWLCNCEIPDQLTGLHTAETEARWTGMPQNQRSVYLPSVHVARPVASGDLGATASHPLAAGSRSQRDKGFHKRASPKTSQLSSVRQAHGTIAKKTNHGGAHGGALAVSDLQRSSTQAGLPSKDPGNPSVVRQHEAGRVALLSCCDRGDSQGPPRDKQGLTGPLVSKGGPMRDLPRERLGSGAHQGRLVDARYRDNNGD